MTVEQERPCPLQVYHCRQQLQQPPLAEPSSTSDADQFDSSLDLPIALQKGKRSCPAHLISNFVPYDYLNLSFRSFALSISSESVPRNYQEVLIPHWKVAMDKEMSALMSHGTWKLVICLVRVSIITCRWVYTIKHKLDGSVDRYKARLVGCGFT